MNNCTWLGVGGPADFLFKPRDLSHLIEFIKYNQQKIIVIGAGSNILVDDVGIRGIVIRLGRNFTQLSCLNNNITAGAAALDYNTAHFALAHNISGLEFFIGIPGTIGGALAMNAGCYGTDTASILKSAKVIDSQGNILELSAREIGYTYRKNNLPQDWIFIEATFSGIKSNKREIQAKMQEITLKRKNTQPIRSKTCGSIFQNPNNHKAWKLIEQAGCRGLSLGNAQISDVHCNFLINKGGATSKELLDLCQQVKEKVKINSGVNLEWEMKILGN